MSNIMYSYKFRLYPTKEQEVLLSKHFGSVRFVYNYFLNQRKEAYQTNKETLNYFANAKELTNLKQQEDFVWLKEINSQTLQATLKNLDSAYNSFFKGLARFPNFKSKKNFKQSFRVPQSVSMENNKLLIPKFKGGIKIKLHRQVEGKIKFATISKNSAGQYFVSLTVERENNIFQTTNKQAVGIDLGIKDLIVCSNGKKYHNLKSKKTLEKRLKLLQKRLSKKVKGSNNRIKAKTKLAIIHNKITNQRTNHIHQITNKLTHDNQVVAMEDLNVKGMVRNHKLANSLSDVAFGEIQRQLEYKSNWRGGTIIKVNRFYPSSKSCSACGWINQNLKLSDREWTCHNCNTHHDRDFNAAKNILWQALKTNTVGTTGIQACGLPNYGRTEQSLRSSGRMKQEAPMPLGSV